MLEVKPAVSTTLDVLPGVCKKPTEHQTVSEPGKEPASCVPPWFLLKLFLEFLPLLPAMMNRDLEVLAK